MNFAQINKKYNTQTKCIGYLEAVRWHGKPKCSHCGSAQSITWRKKTNIYHCNICNRDFSVITGTIFEHTRLALPQWFMLVSLVLNARKGVSSMQLSRDLDVSYKTAWYCTMRMRCAMIENIDDMHGMIEMDEAYIGGKPRKSNIRADDDNKAELSSLSLKKNKRGRGTDKAKVVGMVERKGRVVTKVFNQLNTRNMLEMLKRYVNTENAIVVTDEFSVYNKFENEVQHLIIKHKEQFAKGPVHTNTIEGFWSIIKNGLRGQYHALSKKYLPFYLAEFGWKYNRRDKQKLSFEEFIETALSDEKCFVNYKPIKEVRKIAYPRKRKKAA